MQSKSFFFTLAFVLISTLAPAQNSQPVDSICPVQMTEQSIDTEQEVHAWHKEPDLPIIIIEDDFSRTPEKTPLTPSRTGMRQADVFIFIVNIFK